MYAVVGCGDCEALWVVEGGPERSECPRCGTTRDHALRKRFVETDDPDHAREVRASMLATRQGHGDDFAALDSFAAMEGQLDGAGPDEETYLAGSGIDPEAVAAAADRAGPTGGDSTPRDEVVRQALQELEDPGLEAVVSYAADRDVPRSYVESALAKLVRTGEATENRGTYRLI